MRQRGVTDFSPLHDRPVVHAERRARHGPGTTAASSGRSPSSGPTPDDNGYARPVEGLVTLVDLDTMTVVEVTDHGVVPLPERPGNYSARDAGRAG